MRIALAGNPNSGKTTLFNELTKSNQKIGNWPGVTVERKEGKFFKDKNIEIIDLPGVYSLNPISADEKVTYKFLTVEKPDAIINVIDSTNLDRNLALTLQLLETGIPMVLALNMADELLFNGLTINVAAIEKEFNASAVLISARKNQGTDLLMEKAIAAVTSGSSGTFTSKGNTEEEKAEFRHKYVTSKIDEFRQRTDSKAHKITERIDKILTNRWLAFPIFALIIGLMYFVSVQVVGALCTQGLEHLFFDLIGENLRTGLTNIGAPLWVTSLTVDGIIAGVGTVLTFVPQILMLFLFITFLESCGYMARVAVIMDRIFKKLGLSGKSFIPMIVGCGCSVPAIMSAKTIENEAERKATIMLTPFIPCSAKLPVFALIAGALFPHNPFVAPSMYFLGIFMVILGGLILKAFRCTKKNDDVFVIELPHYRWPKAKTAAKEVWNKTKGFMIRAGVIIVPAAIVLWFLRSFSFSMQMVDVEDSMLAAIGRVVAWVFVPLGFGNWESAIAFLSGVFAKETVVATYGVIFGGDDLAVSLAMLFTPQAAYAFMAFLLLSAPCIAAIATTRKEMGSTKWMFITIGFQFAVAYLVALIINQTGNLWMYNRDIAISIIAAVVVAAIFTFTILVYIKRRKGGGGCKACCSGCSKKGTCSKIEKEENK